MKYFLTILCVVFGFITSAHLKVMTYNIRNSKASDGVNKWDLRKDSLFSLIAQANPDILGTQEVLRDQLRDLQKQFKSYTHVGVGRNNGKRKGEHSTIFF
jgi:endonuclease/exonuclease/phosphatase family metal-dependent hydrolase